MFDILALQNKKLKYLDISFNVMEIGIVHSFRHMLEKNGTLTYLVISGFYKFNTHALETIADR